MLLSRRVFATTALIAPLASEAWAEDIPSPVPGRRVALRGYDPVGYFTDSRPIQGSPRYWYEFDDTVYLFATAEHRDIFIADPDHYAPQYRGYCAMSVAFGGHDEGLPDTWEILDNKLYVFGKPNGPRDFDTDPPGIIARGRVNWAAGHPN
jgi:hypothetical protein